jgi:hypothetical protein
MVKKYLQYGSLGAVARDMDISKAHVRYWVQKYLDNTYHCCPLGGDSYKIPTFAKYELKFAHEEVL